MKIDEYFVISNITVTLVVSNTREEEAGMMCVCVCVLSYLRFIVYFINWIND